MRIDPYLVGRYSFISDALNGTGGFAPAMSATGQTYLIRYPRESDDKFARRNQIAWYRNFMKPACIRFAGYLARKSPIRSLSNPLLQSMADDCDWRGNSLDVFWNDFTVDAKARGSMLLLVDMPRVLPPNQAEQLEARAFPYLVAIPPERVVAYSLDARGLLSMVAIAEDMMLSNGQSETVWRVYTDQSWWIQRAGEINPSREAWMDGDDHGLGVCPVLAFTEAGDFPHVGSFAQLADLSRRYFNAASERDEILRAQTFSLLTYQIPESQTNFDVGQTAEAIGTHNMLIHSGDTPAFIAPPDGPASIYNQVLLDLEDGIRRVAMTVEQPTQAESGIALTIRFQELNASLTAFARRMEDLERRMWWIACRWLRINDTTDVSWPRSYELADLALEMNILQTMQGAGFPPEVVQSQMRSIVGLQFGSHSPDEVNALMDSIDQMSQEVSNAQP